MRRHRIDYALLAFTLLLVFASLLSIYEIGPRVALSEGGNPNAYFQKHLLSVIVSGVAMALGFFISKKKLDKYVKAIMIGALALNFIVPILGFLHVPPAVCTLGACRWVNIGIGTIQPVEILKVAILFYVPWLIKSRKEQGTYGQKELWVPLITLMVVVGIVIGKMQSDLGDTVVIALMIGAMLLVEGLSWKQIGAIAAICVVGGLILIGGSDYRGDRIEEWQGGENYHVQSALVSLGTGGLFGVGLGNSVSSTGYLPEAVNDSIFAILGELYGFFGLMLVLLAYLLQWRRLLSIAQRTVEKQDALFVVGVFVWIFAHVIINVWGQVSLIPMKGITLPFLSAGGTSMVFLAYVIGTCLQISQWTSREIVNEDISSGGRQRRTRHASYRRRT